MSIAEGVKTKGSWGLDRVVLPYVLAPLIGVVWLVLLWGDVRPAGERAEKARLCREAVRDLIQANDSVALDRSTFLIDKLRCDVVEASLAK